MKGFALGLALKERRNATRKSLLVSAISSSVRTSHNMDVQALLWYGALLFRVPDKFEERERDHLSGASPLSSL